MKALVYKGPERFDFQDMPDPVPFADEQVVEVDSVCLLYTSDAADE